MLQEERKTLQAEGLDSGMLMTVRPKVQWYRADGTPLGTLLPTDDYHYQRFKAKGWTLIPPSDTPFLDAIEAPAPEGATEETE